MESKKPKQKEAEREREVRCRFNDQIKNGVNRATDKARKRQQTAQTGREKQAQPQNK